ncbi:MAG: tRNA (adenine-N1)-methyltransferase [Chloroflexi bacterium]|nr:tRNA (adenine-N1)-methyltransferase [Chloroflexota bacterium]
MTNDQRKNEAESNRGPFQPGDIALMYDRRRRRYRVALREGGRSSSHLGFIEHDNIIGRTEGFMAQTSKGHKVVVLRPTFRERVLDLPRQSQVIYPKDLGTLLLRLDAYPGAHVIESGLGSGAASAAILRAIGPTGSLTSYEVREEIIEKAKANVHELAPESTNHNVVVADAYESGFPQTDVDRILLDLPEPWQMTDFAAKSLRPGGILAAYIPTVLQVHQVVMALTRDTRWRLVETIEVIERPWHVTDASVRPEHRMVAHTGFITTARRCEPSGLSEMVIESRGKIAPGKIAPRTEEDDDDLPE